MTEPRNKADTTTAEPAKPSPGNATRPADASWDDDEGENWRHAPRPAKNEGPLESLGKSISETITGSEPDRSKGPKT